MDGFLRFNCTSPEQEELLLFLTFSALVAHPKKTTLHGGQPRSWSAEQGKKEKKKSGSACILFQPDVGVDDDDEATTPQ